MHIASIMNRSLNFLFPPLRGTSAIIVCHSYPYFPTLLIDADKHKRWSKKPAVRGPPADVIQEAVSRWNASESKVSTSSFRNAHAPNSDANRCPFMAPSMGPIHADGGLLLFFIIYIV